MGGHHKDKVFVTQDPFSDDAEIVVAAVEIVVIPHREIQLPGDNGHQFPHRFGIRVGIADKSALFHRYTPFCPYHTIAFVEIQSHRYEIGIYRAVVNLNVSALWADSAAVRRKRLLLEEKLSAKLTDVV